MLMNKHSVQLILVTLIAVLTAVIPAQSTQAAGTRPTEIAHIWRFAYEQTSGQGLLDIMIVEHDRYTHEILQIFNQFSYGVPCTQNRNNIVCDLDIKSAIQDSYLQMNLKEQAAKVRGGESYRWMVTETTGSWNTIPANSHFALAVHPSLQTTVDTDAAGNAMRQNNVWNSHTSSSAYYRPRLGQSFTLVNQFDCSSSSLCITENYVTAGGRTIGLGSHQVAVSTVGFQLDPAQIVITPPAGFQLESFVIDPPKAGYG